MSRSKFKIKKIKKITLTKLLVCFISIFLFGVKAKSQTVTIGDGINANAYNTWPAPYGNWEYGARY
jgi:hypothetical protein